MAKQKDDRGISVDGDVKDSAVVSGDNNSVLVVTIQAIKRRWLIAVVVLLVLMFGMTIAYYSQRYLYLNLGGVPHLMRLESRIDVVENFYMIGYKTDGHHQHGS